MNNKKRMVITRTMNPHRRKSINKIQIEGIDTPVFKELTKKEALEKVREEWSQNPLDYEEYIDMLIKGEICSPEALESENPLNLGEDEE